jgi:hypothetical protein
MRYVNVSDLVACVLGVVSLVLNALLGDSFETTL